MSDIIKIKNLSLEETKKELNNFVSPYSEETFNLYNSARDIVVQSIINIPSVLNIIRSLNAKKILVGVLDKATRKGIKDGSNYIQKSSKYAGMLLAQIKDKTGHIIKQIPLKECLPQESINQISSSLQTIGIQMSLKNITAKLDIIDEKINYFIQGQQNDRIGKILGAFKTYQEAKASNDDIYLKETCYKLVPGVNEAISQIALTLHQDLSDFKKKSIGIGHFFESINFFKNIEAKQQKRIDKIREDLSSIIQGTKILEILYYEIGNQSSIVKAYEFLLSIFKKFNSKEVKKCFLYWDDDKVTDGTLTYSVKEFWIKNVNNTVKSLTQSINNFSTNNKFYELEIDDNDLTKLKEE